MASGRSTMKINEVLVEADLDMSKLTPQQKQQLKSQQDAEDQSARGSIRPGTAFGLGPHSTTVQTPLNDLASAVAAGSAGNMGFRKATEEPYDAAPEGTEFPTTAGTYVKKGGKWILATDTKGNVVNTLATPTYAKTLDKAWDQQNQKKLKQSAKDSNASKQQIDAAIKQMNKQQRDALRAKINASMNKQA